MANASGPSLRLELLRPRGGFAISLSSPFFSSLLIITISISWVNIRCNNSQKSARKAVFHVAPAGERTAQPSEPAPGACSRWRVSARHKSDRLSLRHREDRHVSALWEPAGRDGISLQVPRGARPLGGPLPLLTSVRDLPGCLLCAEHLRGHP